MPLYDGNTQINRVVLTDSTGTPTEIVEMRLGIMPVFPDSVGQLTITNIIITGSAGGSQLTGAIPRAGGTYYYRVEGDPGATFTATGGNVTVSGGVKTLDANGRYEESFTVAGQGLGDPGESISVTIFPEGSTVVQDGVQNPISVSQEAGEPEPSLPGSFFSGVTRATVNPLTGSRTVGSSFTVTIPSGMLSPPSGWTVHRMQWNYLTRVVNGSLPVGIYSTSNDPSPLPDPFGDATPQGRDPSFYQSITCTIHTAQDSSVTRLTSNGTIVYRHTATGTTEGRAYDWRYTYND